MAQTKRKRRTKHRGNAAGVVEARGRTGRKPEASERKPRTREEARQRRMDRLSRPPTWRGAVNRGVIATLVFAGLVLLLFDDQQPATVAILAVFMLAIYIPMGYFMDMLVYRRRQARQGRGTAGAQAQKQRPDRGDASEG